MSVIVSFVTPRGAGSVHAPAIGDCRIRETVPVPGTTTASAQDGELVLICSMEAAVVLAAHGTTPDAQAVAATTATSAGYPIPTSGIVPVIPNEGEKINFKAVP